MRKPECENFVFADSAKIVTEESKAEIEEE